MKRNKFLAANRNQYIVFEYKRHRVAFEVRQKEVRVNHQCILRLDVTRRHLDLDHFLFFLNVNLQKVFEFVFHFFVNVIKVYP